MANWKLDLIEKYPGLEIKDTEMTGNWGKLYVATFKGAANVITEQSIEEWCEDTIRSENWEYKNDKSN
jgi:hypothetical protein